MSDTINPGQIAIPIGQTLPIDSTTFEFKMVKIPTLSPVSKNKFRVTISFDLLVDEPGVGGTRDFIFDKSDLPPGNPIAVPPGCAYSALDANVPALSRGIAPQEALFTYDRQAIALNLKITTLGVKTQHVK